MYNAVSYVKVNPVTVSSCIFLVVTVEVKAFLLGSGYYYLQKMTVFK
jgi:hypothetical protein